MENVVLAIAACALLIVQAQRNFLIIKQLKQKTDTIVNVHVEPEGLDYDAVARALESSWPTVNVSNDVIVDIDYAKLSLAIAQAIQANQPLPVIIPNPGLPNPGEYPSGPWWQGPVSEVEQEPQTITTTSGTEVPVKKF